MMEVELIDPRDFPAELLRFERGRIADWLELNYGRVTMATTIEKLRTNNPPWAEDDV